MGGENPKGKWIEFLRRKTEFLYHITHVDNLERILKEGLFSRNEAIERGISFRDISMKEVQDRRKGKEIFGRTIHDYVALYFNPRNPMMYVEINRKEKIAVIAVSLEVILKEGVIFSDGNAASDKTEFYNEFDALEKLDWRSILAEYWTDGWGLPDYEKKRKICAEVLVPQMVEVEYFEKLFFPNETLKNEMEEKLGYLLENLGISVEIVPAIFFA